MRTNVPVSRPLSILITMLVFLSITVNVKAQTYTTIANGAWTSSSTWQGGSVPPTGTIPLTAVINIKHIVTYSGANISNNGTINISNQTGLAPRLLVPSGVSLTNNLTGKIYISNGEYRQYRFVGGLETGTNQTGSFKNTGGLVSVTNSFVEVAQNWTNEVAGVVIFNNSSLEIGGSYDLKTLAIDSLMNTSVSIGMQGSGDYTADGLNTYFQNFRAEVASNNGKFNLKSGIANGSIDYIALKNHVTNTYSNSQIVAANGLITTGLTLNAYCINNASNYRPNGNFSGPQTLDNSLNYFPAGLMWSSAASSFNFNFTPSLVTGTALQVGAVYKYEGVTPGVDAVLSIDSLIGGATVVKIDDNSGGLGYSEGFQPEIKDGPTSGESYAVFKITYKITGTNVLHSLNTFSITALDIDGTATMKEFDQIGMGVGATAAYRSSPSHILLTQVAPGTFRGINSDGVDQSGIDTSLTANMFTVTNSNVSSFTLKLGTVKTNSTQNSRQFGIYMKGFVYPNLATLPVKLESFTATLNGSKVDLKWITSQELDLNHFVIEKSYDGKNFSDAGIVFAYGNTSERKSYSFPDNIANVQQTVIYYRLRSVDNDGNSKLSETRIIRLGKQSEMLKMVTYPNPASSELRVTVPAAWQNKAVMLEVFNFNGQKIKTIKNTNASQTETIAVDALAKGFYLLKATCGTEIAQQKFIKN